MLRLTMDDRFERMPWEEIDAVVFDVGNVLVRFDPAKMIRSIFPEDDLYDALLLQRVFRTPYWLMLDRGVISLEEAVQAMVGRHREIEPCVRKIIYDRLGHITAIDEGVEALRICKAHGKKLYVLSNYQEEAFAGALRRFDFFDLFDGCVVSAQEKLMKPEGTIYRVLTERYRLDPARVMFIDDTCVNIEAAMNEGWQGLCYDRPGKLLEFLGE